MASFYSLYSQLILFKKFKYIWDRLRVVWVLSYSPQIILFSIWYYGAKGGQEYRGWYTLINWKHLENKFKTSTLKTGN